MEGKAKLSQEEIDSCISMLEQLVDNTNQVFELPEEKRIALMKAAGQLTRPQKDEFTRRRKDAKKAAKRKMIERDKHARKETGIRSAREATIFIAPKLLELPEEKELELESPRNCYVCKKTYTKLHHFYDTMCQECGDFNYAKRFQTTDLTGQVAVITGSRLKIGYHITLMLLRAGATVVATTRFPADSALRFSKEDDFQPVVDLHLTHLPETLLLQIMNYQKYKEFEII